MFVYQYGYLHLVGHTWSSLNENKTKNSSHGKMKATIFAN